MANASSHQIITRITDILFAPDNRRLQGWIDQICNKNKNISDIKDRLGFWYDGRYFRPSWLLQGKYPKAILHHHLYPEMDDFVADEKKTKEDQQYIRQTLFALLEPCNNYQDIRDTLPECIFDILPELRMIERIQNPAFTIKDNKRAYKQYMQILPTIETYCATRLIF